MYSGILLEFLNMGGGEIMLILAVVLLLFGGKKLPELARGLGKGIREFKDASDGVKREIHRNINSVNADDDDLPQENNGINETTTAKENEHNDSELEDPTITPPANQHSPTEVTIDKVKKTDD